MAEAGWPLVAAVQTLVFRFEAAGGGRRFVRLSRVEDVSYAGATTSTSRMLDSTELAAAALILHSSQNNSSHLLHFVGLWTIIIDAVL